jgi:hypothetical protein
MSPSRCLLLASVAVCATSAADPAPWLLGHWRVVGCATSPGDPANCAHGDIVFEAARWSIALPCCKRAASYRVVSTAPDKITIDSEGSVTELRLAADGHAAWNPGGLGGRVGELSFVRATP